jgi:hypothetical protein
MLAIIYYFHTKIRRIIARWLRKDTTLPFATLSRTKILNTNYARATAGPLPAQPRPTKIASARIIGQPLIYYFRLMNYF